MPKNKFKNDSSKLPTDKNALLVIYCKGEYVLVDIKERRDFNEVHIPLAINFPVHISRQYPTDYRIKKTIVCCNKESRTIERTGN